MRRLREQHELRAARAMAVARQRSENSIRQFTGNKITENSQSSTLQLLSQNSQTTNGSAATTTTTTNGMRKNYGNVMKNTNNNSNNNNSNHVTNADTPAITVTTLKQLEQQMNYLELCYSE